MKQIKKGNLPDIASHSSSSINSKIDWVGMDQVALPCTVLGEPVLAKVNVYVNILDPSAKGIHMSRLYLVLGKTLLKKNLNVKVLKSTLKQLIDSQAGLSDCARVELRWTQPMSRPALLSEYSGWKGYPTFLRVEKNNNKINWQLGFSTFYSSTCPCSAALARQLRQNQFKKDFKNKNLNMDEILNWLGEKQVSSAHSQRSRADVKLTFKEGKETLDFVKYLDIVEGVLKTPVQTAVKREDEQEFARLNGENLMFVEDALRKMKDALEPIKELKDFVVKTRHFESLHAHDAAGIIRKG